MRFIKAIFLITVAINSFGQQQTEQEILIEAKKLYRSEMASWYGTDLFMEKFQNKVERTEGYLSYSLKDRSICVFYSKDSVPKILARLSFDSTFSTNTALIDKEDRLPSDNEANLISIRRHAFKALKRDTLFRFYKDTNPNLIPLNDEYGKRVYILTGPQKQGVVIFGNDYLLTYDKEGRLKNKRRLHKNIIHINYNGEAGKEILASMHSHLPETGDLITATDVCTLMLYEKFVQWKQHYVISANNVSIWDCKKDKLVVMTREAWNKIEK